MDRKFAAMNTTNSFFNHFVFIIHFQHKGYLNSWLYFMSFSFTTGHFCMCAIWKIIFHFYYWLSFQRLCRLLLGYTVSCRIVSYCTRYDSLQYDSVLSELMHSRRGADNQK